MSSKIFNKTVQPSCAWCLHGKKSAYTDDILCNKKGIKSKFDSCRQYKYDALKRTPQKQKATREFTSDDFKL